MGLYSPPLFKEGCPSEVGWSFASALTLRRVVIFLQHILDVLFRIQ